MSTGGSRRGRPKWALGARIGANLGVVLAVQWDCSRIALVLHCYSSGIAPVVYSHYVASVGTVLDKGVGVGFSACP